MVGQQDEIRIEGGHGIGVRLLAVEHVQEIGCMSHAGPWGDGIVSVAQPLPGGDDGGDDRRQ